MFFYDIYKHFFILGIKNALFNVFFIFFPNVYYILWLSLLWLLSWFMC